MAKLLVLASFYGLCVNLQAQQRMIIDLEPAFDVPASIEIRANPDQPLQLIFRQPGTRPLEASAFSWVQDTASIVPVRKLGRYFQQFAFSDTIRFETQQAAGLLQAFTEVYSHKDKLAKLTDERLLLDGMPCSITIPVNQQTQYLLSYRPPVSPQTRPIDRLIREVLSTLKMRSINPATVNYCMIVDQYLN